MKIADRIQRLRKLKGISQEELAAQVGVSRQAVSKWESEQSTPDLEKIIIMSEYFGVTTDYILKGVETQSQQRENKSFNVGQILYIASTAFLAIGLLTAFGSWYAEQSAESIWGSLIIQAVGVVAYFIGNIYSPTKAPFIINWLNITIALFLPISLIVTFVFSHSIAPYPIDVLSSFAFAVAYLVAMVSSFCALKRNSN